ncbi:hypothetical protein IFM58399_09237 [Aspergillus lentulus]|uniref:Inner centromere protein ARK-binding domain-containing protein n=1 Tax=Aspergillus lentulus TaxID=293939 RepID=A0ABQ1A0X1_ASPLE|nr:uncharacterized protein IFM58399_09237 [Aspergillus lentulus]GFF52092.1 hypothetical protein IFM58399_09237 [Aspergillus lentulus]GFF69485.1 hypothetical protein IFM47457_02397 [Aspergillus lentulus]GFF70663.1 hypothetical protein IFM60648_03231 [Aspergillus lentulus]GFF75551.1 hypothetical protein IFM62136_09098 [Aspergillus lentulus]GFG03796.1 hypothetical protein IFM61392_02992 [Aspergillus lentulus]
MLALRDQENLVHTHQTVAAAKPLNHGVKQLQPRTPGARAPKTPFKVPLNDENDPLAFGKKTVKAAGKQKANTKPAKDAFVTPLEPRNRAPLGMKTTNAKAKGLQTPAAPAGTIKPEKTNKRASTQKIRKFSPLVDQPKIEVQGEESQDDVPDIEYMPPKPKELPDIPDDITYDTTFPQFQPKNLALGLESVYGDNQVGEDGLTKRQRKFQEDSIAFDKKVDEMILKQLEEIGFEDKTELDPPSEPHVEEVPKRRLEMRRAKSTMTKPKYTSNISTVRAHNAVAALSRVEPSGARARPAAMSKPKPRVASSLLTSRRPRVPSNLSSMRHAAATANSKTTLGYSKGRTVSSRLHGKPSTTPERSVLSPETYIELYGMPPLGSEMWYRCKAAGCFDSEEDRLAAKAERNLPTFGEDEEAQNFQLTL